MTSYDMFARPRARASAASRDDDEPVRTSRRHSETRVMSTPSTSTSTRATDPYDHVALRRAYDDISAVIAAGYDEDTRTVDADCLKSALIVACVAQLAFARGSISAGAQWSLVVVYALFVSVAHGWRNWWRGTRWCRRGGRGLSGTDEEFDARAVCERTDGARAHGTV